MSSLPGSDWTFDRAADPAASARPAKPTGCQSATSSTSVAPMPGRTSACYLRPLPVCQSTRFRRSSWLPDCRSPPSKRSSPIGVPRPRDWHWDRVSTSSSGSPKRTLPRSTVEFSLRVSVAGGGIRPATSRSNGLWHSGDMLRCHEPAGGGGDRPAFSSIRMTSGVGRPRWHAL